MKQTAQPMAAYVCKQCRDFHWRKYCFQQCECHRSIFYSGISSGTKIFTLLESIVMAIQTGLSVYIGQNLGAGRILRVRKASNQTVLSAMGLAVILNVIVQGAAPQLVSLFLSKSDPLYMQTLHVAAADVRVITLGIFIWRPCISIGLPFRHWGIPSIPCMRDFCSWQPGYLRLQCCLRLLGVRLLSVHRTCLGGDAASCGHTLLQNTPEFWQKQKCGKRCAETLSGRFFCIFLAF